MAHEQLECPERDTLDARTWPVEWRIMWLCREKSNPAASPNRLTSFRNHPLDTRELKLLKRLKKQQEPSRYIFLSERGSPITTSSEH
jgi:integrase